MGGERGEVVIQAPGNRGAGGALLWSRVVKLWSGVKVFEEVELQTTVMLRVWLLEECSPSIVVLLTLPTRFVWHWESQEPLYMTR